MEAMTLEQVRGQIAAVATNDDYMLQGWIAAIDAHLAHAQAVDVGALVGDLSTITRGELPDGDGVDVSVSLWAERWLGRLTRALSGEAGPVGDDA